jgi:acetyltransferase-like isoleucine patch superfamily enzyme
MFTYILEIFISFIKKRPYSIDAKIGFVDFTFIIFKKIVSLFRGLLITKLFRVKSSLFIFIDKNVIIEYGSNITIGRGALLKRNSRINGLAKNRFIIGENFSLGENSIIESTGVLSNVGEGIEIGDNVGINSYCYMHGGGGIVIKNDVILGPRVSVLSENHCFKELNVPIRNQGTTKNQVIIENGAWLGSGCIILPGVTIGEGSIIASGAVVTKNVDSYSIVAGVPAKQIKLRK